MYELFVFLICDIFYHIDFYPVLLIVHKVHPELIVPLPGHLDLGRPVEPVRRVFFPVGLIETPERRQRVLFMPFGAAHTHEVARRLISHEGW